MSFRLGLADGVSIVAGSWRRALESLGFNTVTVAAEGPVDRVVPGLALAATEPPDAGDLASALADADLVVAENILSIPINLAASRAVARELRGRPALLHHHDPPWQRERFAHIDELPPTDPAWRHVVINDLTRTEFAERGIEATTIYNGFDDHPAPGDRDGTRASLAVAADELLVAHPVRAIARKNIGAALRITAVLGGTYWLLGEPEEGYDDTLAALLADAPCRVIHRAQGDVSDIYAAADVVAFPSTWEGFGNPPIEAAFHRRPVVIGDYPVGAEIRALGFEWFDPDGLDALSDWLADADPALLDHNEAVARKHFSQTAMTEKLGRLLDEAGWSPR